MAIKLKLADGTSVEADSVKELAEFYQHLGRNGHSVKAVTPPDISQPPALQAAPVEPLPPTAVELLQLLLSSTEPIDTAEVSETLGVKPRGIGGYILALTNWGKRNGYHRKQILLKDRRKAEGKSVRTITLTKSFRQQLREGKIAGMPRTT
jgi:hypothetical protein